MLLMVAYGLGDCAGGDRDSDGDEAGAGDETNWRWQWRLQW